MAEFSHAFSAAFDALVFDASLPLTLAVSPSTVKRRDTHPITLTVKDPSGAAVDLAGWMVRLLARPALGGPAVVLASALGAGLGTVTHQLTGALPAAAYRLEVESTLAGVIVTAPSSGYAILSVVPDLA